jgi:hypothetical protein
MVRETGKIICRGSSTWMVPIYVGRDPEGRAPQVHFLKGQGHGQLFVPYVTGAD